MRRLVFEAKWRSRSRVSCAKRARASNHQWPCSCWLAGSQPEHTSERASTAANSALTSAIPITAPAAPPALTYPLTILVVQAAIQALIRSVARHHPRRLLHRRERPLALRVHRAAAPLQHAHLPCTLACLLDRTARVQLRRQTPTVHAERGWGSCTREEDFAGQNPLLPEIRSTSHHSRARSKPRTPTADSRSL